MLPFVAVDRWWRSGLAAAFSPAICFVAGGTFLFAAARRIFDSTAAGVAAAGMVALNPNLLYLQSTAMTEAVFYVAFMALLYFVSLEPTAASAVGAGIAACAGTLARYDGWIVLPFVAVYLLFQAPRCAMIFSAIAALGPLYWMANGWYATGDALDFLRGPYTAFAIQGSTPYPGRGDWHTAWYYYRNAVGACAGPLLSLMALAGGAIAIRRRAWFPLLLLALPGLFVIWSMHSGAVPIFMPHLWPFSYYNTRYGLAALPLLGFCAAALVTRPAVATLAVALSISPWLVHPSHERWITWAESRTNSEGRRAWMQDAAAWLAPRFVRGSGIISSSGDDFFGIYREMGIPLRETFSICNGLRWEATLARPDLFLWQEWAVVRGGNDPVRIAIVERAPRYGIRYRLELTIRKKDEPVIEIYRRIGGTHGTA